MQVSVSSAAEEEVTGRIHLIFSIFLFRYLNVSEVEDLFCVEEHKHIHIMH